MWTAITREPGPSLGACELTHLERRPIDVVLAARQHARYREALGAMGLAVIDLPVLPGHPDAVFVEDTAVVLDEIAVITRPGAASRRGETDAIAPALAAFRPLARLATPATLDGGDVMRLGRTLYVGRSARTSAAGIDALGAIVRPLGYSVVTMTVRHCLHLKSACCRLDDARVLVQPAWLEDATALRGIEVVEVPPAEPAAANVLAHGNRVLVPASHPRTAEQLAGEGFDVITVDNSELQKAEAGVTCSSLVFASDVRAALTPPGIDRSPRPAG